ncbi:MAG: hypothetical protein BMS9Abin01_1584 [Gammaproteobacteria bacterium]|nr:MAG: hypothetical protein BMS9Abin01_1584 [Gammaproteobacteria bacterium]
MLDQFAQSVLPTVEHFQYLGYWIAFFAALLETALVVGLLLPGSTLLLILGALSASGHLDFNGVLWFGIAGAVLGDNINYWLGRRYGQRWTRSGVWFLKQDNFDEARRFFDAHGAKSVFLGRFIPGVKELAPFVAGSVGMRSHTFLFWNLLGAIGWGLEWVGAGYLFARSLTLAQLWLSRVGLLLAALLILSLLLWMLKRFILRHGRQWLHFASSLGSSIKAAIVTNPEVENLLQSHPRFFVFLAARLDSGRFEGLTLSLLALVFLFITLLFAGVVEDLVTSDPIVALDKSLAQLVAVFRSDEIARVFIWITELGAWQVVIPSASVAALALWLARREWLVVPLVSVMVGSEAMVFMGKLAFHRARPVEALLAEHSYSFPSGHASVAVAFYGFLGYLLIRSARQWKTRVNLFFAAAILIFLIGISRIVLGVHYLSDVWGGYLLGSLWLVIGISMSEWLVASNRVSFRSAVPIAARRLAVGLGVVAFTWYVGFTASYQPRYAAAPAIQTQAVTGELAKFLEQQVPAYTKTALGARQQPIGLAVIARDESTLRAAFSRAGWRDADRPNFSSLAKLIRSGLSDVTAPVAPAFWDGRINDLAFEKGLESPAGKRILAVQLWRTPYETANGSVFVAVVKAFSGIRWGILRSIDPDLDRARDALSESFRVSGLIADARDAQFVPTAVGRTFTGEEFFTRGNLLMLVLTVQSTDNQGKESKEGGTARKK